MTLTLEALLLIFIAIFLAMMIYAIWQNIGGLPLLLKQHHQERLAEMKSLRAQLDHLQKSLDERVAALSNEMQRLSEKEQNKLSEMKSSVEALRKSMEDSIKF